MVEPRLEGCRKHVLYKRGIRTKGKKNYEIILNRRY